MPAAAIAGSFPSGEEVEVGAGVSGDDDVPVDVAPDDAGVSAEVVIEDAGLSGDVVPEDAVLSGEVVLEGAGVSADAPECDDEALDAEGVSDVLSLFGYCSCSYRSLGSALFGYNEQAEPQRIADMIIAATKSNFRL